MERMEFSIVLQREKAAEECEQGKEEEKGDSGTGEEESVESEIRREVRRLDYFESELLDLSDKFEPVFSMYQMLKRVSRLGPQLKRELGLRDPRRFFEELRVSDRLETLN